MVQTFLFAPYNLTSGEDYQFDNNKIEIFKFADDNEIHYKDEILVGNNTVNRSGFNPTQKRLKETQERLKETQEVLKETQEVLKEIQEVLKERTELKTAA